LQALAVFLLSWAIAILLVILFVTGGTYPPEAHVWAYLFTTALLVLGASLLAFHWGLSSRGAANGSGSAGLLNAWFFAAARGMVFTAASAVGLLILAAGSNAPAELAGAAATVMAVESFVFAGVAAGAAWWFPGRAGSVLAWSVGAFLLVGNIAAVTALLPAVRSYEAARVVINVQRDEFGRTVSYECSPEFAGIVEVVHTERVVWLAASHPLAVFALLAGEASPGTAVLGWLPAEFEAAAAGSRVPCTESATMEENEVQVPLAIIGVAIQFATAGGLLLAGRAASRRRAWLLSP
jgi:hypothetical protein